MASNQASIFLFAPRFGPVVKIDPSAKTASGEPLQILSTEMIDPKAVSVSVADVRQWFINHGFSEKERYGGCQILFRDQHTGSLGTEAVIDLSLRPGKKPELL